MVTIKNFDLDLTENKPKTYFQRRLYNKEVEMKLTDKDIKNLSREELYQRLEDNIGNTPLNRIELENGSVAFQKDETGNPTESHYDRCYIKLLKGLEFRGKIKPGDVLLETTSGSAGVSFAWLCKKLGYEAHVFMPAFLPKPRILEVTNLAHKVHLADDKDRYLAACAEEMVDYFKQNLGTVRESGRGIHMPNHSQDDSTPGIFAEIMDECQAQMQGENVDIFVGGIGNGSTLLGVGKRLKELNDQAKVFAFEPMSACPFYKRHIDKWGKVAPKFVDDADLPEKFTFHQLPGTGSFGNIDFPFMVEAVEDNIVDDVTPIPDKYILDTVTYNDALPREFKLGNSSLVSRYIAERVGQTFANQNILILAYDRADRYGEPQFIEEVQLDLVTNK